MQSQIGNTVNLKSRKILEEKEKKQSEQSTNGPEKKDPVKRIQPQRVPTATAKKEIEKRRSPNINPQRET